MTGGHWIVVGVGVALLSLPAWMSVRCLIKARQFLRWRRPSLKGLDGQLAALRGEVRARYPVKIWTIGDCLWHREVVRIHVVGSKASSMKTASDLSTKAEFSLAIDGRDYAISDLPTRVYGARSRKTWSGDRIYLSYWLPVADYLTVLGRVRQKGSRWEIVKDPKIGLIYSTHPAELTAFRELVKAVLGLAVVAAGVLILFDILTR